MAIYYQNNFEANAIGADTDFIQNDSGAFVVGTNLPVQGLQAYGEPASAVDGHTCCLTKLNGVAITPIANARMLFAQRANLSGPITTAGTNFTNVGPGLRCTSDNQNGYYLVPGWNAATEPQGLIGIYKRVSGTYTLLQNFAVTANYFNGANLADGDYYWTLMEVSGTTISFKMWLVGMAEPSAWLQQYTDSSISAAGYCGLRIQNGGAYAKAATVDSLNFGDAGQSFLSVFTPASADILLNGRWNNSAGTATTINSGGGIDFIFTGPFLQLNFNVAGVTSGANPEIYTRVDDQSPVRQAIAAAVVLSPTIYPDSYGSAPRSFVGSEQHRCRVTIAGIYEGAGDSTLGTINQWTSQAAALLFTGVSLDPIQSLLSPPNARATIEFLGDSTTASIRLLYINARSCQTQMDSTIHFPQYVADYLGLNPIVTGFGGQGVTQGGSGSVPAANAAFPYVYSGAAWSPAVAPVAVVFMQGVNDANAGATAATFQADYITFLATVRVAYPKAIFFVVVPPNMSTFGTYGSGYPAALANVAASDAKAYLLNYNTGVLSGFAGQDYSDNIAHWNPGGAAKLASQMASDIQTQLTTLGYGYQAQVVSQYAIASAS